jgi:hypothetical protein
VAESDILSELSSRIPLLNQKKTVVMDQAIIKEGENHSLLLEQSMKLIDLTKNIQVFAGPGEIMRDNLEIRVQRQLGKGSQADVY